MRSTNHRASAPYHRHSPPYAVRLALIADVHSNLEALTAVLAEVDKRGVDQIVCLGDVVGYGADAQACVDLVRERCAVTVLGNHDEAVVSGNVQYLPRDGQAAALHNRAHLDADALAWLAALPTEAVVENTTLVHATPQLPKLWLRADSFQVSHAQFQHFDTPICFAGHMHMPAVVGERIGQMRVKPGGRFFVVCGSTGQPRDANPRAFVGFFDTEAFAYEPVRVPYNVDEAARRIVEAGLPVELGRRLRSGR